MKDNSKLLNVLENTKTKREIEEFLIESTDADLLYHFSEVRENILNWYPFEDAKSFLEIGSECGALTGFLCENVEKVVALETDLLMNEVNRKRNENSASLEITEKKVENLEPRKFQYISLIGTLEKLDKYTDITDVKEFLIKVKSFLTEEGQLFVAIDNRFAIKKWAGCVSKKSDGTPYIFDKGYTYMEIKNLLEEVGFTEIQFLFPNPDYVFPMEIFDESRVPESGMLRGPLPSYYSERLVAFDEMKAFDAVCKDGKFRDFINSFLIICR